MSGRPMVSTKLPKLLRRLRLEAGLTLREAETRSGVSNAYISQLESGKIQEPSPHKLWLLALAYAAPGGPALQKTYLDLFVAAGYRVPMEIKAASQTRPAPPLG